MDFFAHQEQARRNTTKLVALFCLAVVGIIGAIYLVAVIAFATADAKLNGETSGFWHPEILLLSTAGTLLVVVIGSLYKINQLRGGGQVVATLLGGRRVAPNTRDPREKVLLNIVEETSIASGTPVPAVFVLDSEKAINAFAAGFSPSDAVIGVTAGTLEQLNRDELQGVIAHEFSHILNGDMRLNIRLIGVLHGILCIALAGYVILRSGAGFRGRGGKNSAAGGILALAIALLVIGYIGMFFAKLIQAAVSRQREFLADASAVQFTRNPDGLVGVLKKLGGYEDGSHVNHAQAAATSHMFFGRPLKPAFSNALATHPPLKERIRRIDRTFRAEHAQADTPRGGGAPAAGAAGFAGGAALSSAGPETPASPARLVAQAGQPTNEHLAHAQVLVGSLPASVTDAMHYPFSARALIYAMLFDRDTERRHEQLELLKGQTDPATLKEARKIAPHVADLDATARLPLVDLSIPALREMSPNQYRSFESDIDTLIHADQEVGLFEFALRKVLKRHLSAEFGDAPAARPRYRSVKPLMDDVQILLSSLARVGHDDEQGKAEAYLAGITILPGDGELRPLLDAHRAALTDLDGALDRIAQSTPNCKRFVLRACAETAAHDGVLTSDEMELLRAVADTLDCPMPPILFGKNTG